MSTIINLKQEGKRYSFYQLLKEKKYSIEIPIIQRDYAQGRKSKGEVRDLFLQALYDYLEDNIPNRDLDFVYGSTEVEEGNEKFIPLDGQQRLTTLFLLHWYLATISGNIEDFREVLVKDDKSKFTYLTRTSSSEFCDALLQNTIDFANLLPNDKDKKNSLSKTIKDCGWYFLSWGNDPTIQSMLTMLDSINEKFCDKPYFFARLTDNINPIITFLYLDLGEFKLTEDLYIKMNSRGKPLTTFENFKAKLEQHIEKIFLTDTKTYTLNFEGVEKKVETKEYFSFNIDTKWANLFWQYRALAGKDNNYDDELMNFIRVIVSNQYAIEPEVNIENFKYLIKSETNSNDSEYISYQKLKTINALSSNCIKYLIDAFDNLVNGDNKIKSHLTDSFYYDEKVIFERVLTHKISLPERIRFYAYMKFLIQNPNDFSGLHQWMRVVYNLSENTQLNSAEEAEKAIKSIDNLASNCNDILNYLVSDNCKIDFYLGRQIQEERIKANLINLSDEWKNAIENTEKHHYFSGQICFILEFSGILNFYELNEHCNWDLETNDSFYHQFINYANKSGATFDIIGTEKNKDFIWERSVLTKGDYLIPSSYNRYNFLNTSKNLRDYSWKRLLRLTPIGANEYNEWKVKRDFVKAVFDDSLFILNDLEQSLENICENVPNDWRKHFVKNPVLIRYCQQGFMYFQSDSQIQLLMQSQINHRHREMYSYNFYLEFLNKNKESLMPFKNVIHEQITTYDELSFAVINDWCFQDKYYEISIVKSDNDIDSYSINFYISEGDKNLEVYSDKIKEILLNKEFTWNEESKYFCIMTTDENNTFVFLQNLCTELNKLPNE
jgi:hypothetical protein